MYEKIIGRFCLFIVLAQLLLYLGISFGIVDASIFPDGRVFLGLTIAGCIIGVIGIGLLIKRKFYGEAVGIETMLICSLPFALLALIQVLFGLQNIDFTKGNDYSTDVSDVPQYQSTKEQRPRSQKVISLRSSMDVPHQILKSDTDSLMLPVSGLTSKIILKRSLNNLGWSVTHRALKAPKSARFSETYEVIGRLSGTPFRTELAIRIVSDNGSFSVIDIRSSFPGRRRDLGLNEIMIQKLSEDIYKVAENFTF